MQFVRYTQEHLLIRQLLNFQTNQPVFVRLLQGAFRVSHCQWLTGPQRYHVENCIKTLSDSGMSVCLCVSLFLSAFLDFSW